MFCFQTMSPPDIFDDVDGLERGRNKTDDLRAMTTLGPRTLGIWVLFHWLKIGNSTTWILVAPFVRPKVKVWGKCLIVNLEIAYKITWGLQDMLVHSQLNKAVYAGSVSNKWIGLAVRIVRVL